MCGIFGYVGKRCDLNTLLHAGLRQLEYRGYDSWGIAVAAGDSIALARDVGKLPIAAPSVEQGESGIGHTRWATTGAVTVHNAHPHLVDRGRLALVHNGVVENFQELRSLVLKKGYELVSETDSEVVAHLVVDEVARNGGSLVDALRRVSREVEGLNAFVVLDVVSGTLAATKTGSPLYVGEADGALLIASDVSALLPHTDRVMRVADGQTVGLSTKGIELFNSATGQQELPIMERINWRRADAEIGSYSSFLEKEIHEQPELLRRIAAEDGAELLGLRAVVQRAKEIWLTGCGTAYHAGMIGAQLLNSREVVRSRAVHAHELPQLVPTLTADDALIALSQSGETIDVLDALRAARQRTVRLAALVNVPGSSIAHEVGTHLLIGAGPERSVLSTKAYTAMLGYLIKLAYLDGGVANLILREAAGAMDELLSSGAIELVERVARELQHERHMFLLGSGMQYPLALEGALKIKEVSYLHAEGFPAGELKHGVIALIEPGTPVVALVPEDDTRGRILVNVGEVKARGARVIGISSEPHPSFDVHIPVHASGLAFALAAVVPLQLLGLHLARLKGLDPDKPRNLAKSVTVR